MHPVRGCHAHCVLLQRRVVHLRARATEAASVSQQSHGTGAGGRLVALDRRERLTERLSVLAQVREDTASLLVETVHLTRGTDTHYIFASKKQSVDDDMLGLSCHLF